MYVLSPGSSLARIRQKTHSSACPAPVTYSLRQPAHSRSNDMWSRARLDLLPQTVDERAHAHAALDLAAHGLETEPIGELEVARGGGDLPRPTAGGSHVDVELGGARRPLALGRLVPPPRAPQRLPEGGGGCIPLRRLAQELLRPGGK